MQDPVNTTEHTPLIVLQGLQGNPPVTLTPLQQTILPYTPYITFFWWMVWCATLTYLIVRTIAIPLIKQNRY